MTRPIRLRLSRRKGFDLQALSRATNGLPAVKVSRPGPWGNPFSVHPQHEAGKVWGLGAYISVPTVEDAVACFAEMMACDACEPGQRSFDLRKRLPELRGKNLACWCRIIDRHGSYVPCHADMLLSLANQLTCEEVRGENLRRAEGEKAR